MSKVLNSPNRRRAVIDGRAVSCPYASMLGTDLGKIARVGDFIAYGRNNGAPHLGLGRMIARVNAPIDGNSPAVKNHILALVLSWSGHDLYERWVDPLDVVQVVSAPTKLANWFFQPKLPYGAETLLRLSDHGTLCELYVDKVEERVAEWRQRDKT